MSSNSPQFLVFDARPTHWLLLFGPLRSHRRGNFAPIPFPRFFFPFPSPQNLTRRFEHGTFFGSFFFSPSSRCKWLRQPQTVCFPHFPSWGGPASTCLDCSSGWLLLHNIACGSLSPFKPLQDPRPFPSPRHSPVCGFLGWRFIVTNRSAVYV